MAKAVEFSRIGVIGAGVMGTGVAVDLLLSGKEVILVDRNEQTLDAAQISVKQQFKFALMIKGLTTGHQNTLQNNIQYTVQLNQVRDCEVIIENIWEDRKSKEQLYTLLDSICNPNVLFAANTSCISITEIGAAVSRPERVIGMHFMNPVYMKQVIEVIRGFHTSPEWIGTAQRFLGELGKKGIVVADYPGFVANRISHLFMNEAAFVVQDQVATPEQVDAIFKNCYEHKMGPLETADLIGLDTVVDSLQVLYDSYQDSKYRCCPLLKKMVSAGKLGKKTKEGFYRY